MSDPPRLLHDPAVSPETKELLSSLGAPSQLAAGTRAAIGARVAKSVVAPAAAKLVSVKAVALLAGALVAGGAGLMLLARGTPAPPPAPRVVPAPPAVAPRVEAAPEPEPAIENVAPEAPEPGPKAPAARAALRRDTLAIEESLLEQARRASDSPARALSLLREHERRFPNGELTAERLYLTSQVNARAGNLPAARRAAAQLAARFPKSTYLPRVRSLLDDGTK
ncbi:MAG TPA: hypothetical protein VFZ53_13230 [Polyangiaceae bacterium]